MANNKPKYLIQCRYCGYLLLKTQEGLMFNTEIKCPNCKTKIRIPDDIVITVDKKTLDNINKNGIK